MQQNKNNFILITGGRRSGKSTYALDLAQSLGDKRLYLATAEAWDEEMKARISRHREERGDGWETVEEPLNVEDIIASSRHYDVILVDCLTLWLSNVMHEDEDVIDDEYILERIGELAIAFGESKNPVIVVTNELGLGVIPDNPLSRRFTDLAGIMNQQMAAAADRVVFTVSGIPMTIKGN